jgi:hypothetical protein
MADISEIMTRQAAAGFRIRLEASKAGSYRAALREDDSRDWATIRSVGDGTTTDFADPLTAMVNADSFILQLVAARQTATAREALAALDRVLGEDRLLRRVQDNGDGTTSIVWRVRKNDGTNTKAEATPEAAAIAWIAAGAP